MYEFITTKTIQERRVAAPFLPLQLNVWLDERLRFVVVTPFGENPLVMLAPSVHKRKIFLEPVPIIEEAWQKMADGFFRIFAEPCSS